MRNKSLGAAVSVTLASIAMLAVPATANAADKIHFDSGVKISVTREADKSIKAAVENPTGVTLTCDVLIGDRNVVETAIDIAYKYRSVGPDKISDEDWSRLQKEEDKSNVVGIGYIWVESPKTGIKTIDTERDDQETKPEGYAKCIDSDDNHFFAATIDRSPDGSLDLGGSLAGNTGSVSSLDFGGSLGL